MTTKAFDVVVVGAGPAGCSAAFDLANSGARVGLLDRRSFPRIKPCGGALTIKSLSALRFSIAPVIRAYVTEFVAGREYTRAAALRSRDPIAAMTVREDFDAYVLDKTISAGAEFVKIEAISQLVESNGEVMIKTDNGQITSRFLIGADGANSTVRRLLGNGEHRFGFAIEGQVVNADELHRGMTFDFGVVPRGYGWIFPKGDHYNVGIYTYDSRFRLFPSQLASYAKEKLGKEPLRVVGAPIGMFGSALSSRNGRVLLVGDAAGLCEPILGEGIYYAIKSGQLAASSILSDIDGTGSAAILYGRAMKSIRSELRFANMATIAFYRDLGLGCLFLCSPIFRYVLMKSYSLGIPFGGIPNNLVTLPFRQPQWRMEEALDDWHDGTRGAM